MTYFDELKKSMEWLADKQNTIFLGQSVAIAGTSMYNTLKDIVPFKRIEMPVIEESQLGMSFGLAISGYVPISVFPRLNFLLCAMNQLVNHIDKYPLMSGYKEKVIIRCGIGSISKLDPQDMHRGDYTDAIKSMCKTIKVTRLEQPEDIFPAYEEAYYADHSSLLVEVSDFFDEDFRLYYKKFRENYNGR